MNRAHNYLSLNYPNIPVLPSTELKSKPIGEFFATPQDEKHPLDPSVSDVKSVDMYLPNFSLRMLEGKFEKDVMFTNLEGVGSEFLGSCLFLKGHVKSLLPGKSEAIDIYGGAQNFKYDPNNEFRHWSAAGDPLHFIHFSFTYDHFNQFLPEDECWANLLRKRIEGRKRVLGARATPITLAQEHALQNIFECPLSGKLGHMMIETSVVQIILIQLHNLFGGSEMKVQKPAGRDIEIVHALKQHLLKTYLEDHSLDNLAKDFGTNTNKLMTLFKKVFNKRIFEYISELRMEHARLMLHEKDARIVDVARTIGYRNPNHFSAAFKKKYGFNPSMLKAA